MKKVLFISYDGMTDPLGQSQVLPYLQGLSKAGYCFYLLSCEKPAAYLQNKKLVQQQLAGFNIEWHPVMYTKNPPVLSTLKDIRKLKQKARQLHQQHQLDMVHTRPGIPALVGLWMKQRYGIKFLHDIREFYADSRVEGGIWNIANPLYRLIYKYFKQQENKQLASCDGIVCLTYAAENIIKALPAYKPATPLQVIPCSVDMNLFDASLVDDTTQQQLKKQLGIAPGDIVLSYLGSIGGWYLTPQMLRFCKLLLDAQPAVKFLFITPQQHEQVHALAAQFGIPAQQLIIQRASRTEIPALLSVSTWSVFFIKPCYSKLSSSPTKHGELMAMGIPVITNSGVGDVQAIVQKYQSGFVLDDFTDAAFLQVINQLPAAVFNQQQIRQGAKEVYALDKAIDKYKHLYQSMLAE
jgi:glycosyltransferase involved in cell wall biosynthesis